MGLIYERDTLRNIWILGTVLSRSQPNREPMTYQINVGSKVYQRTRKYLKPRPTQTLHKKGRLSQCQLQRIEHYKKTQQTTQPHQEKDYQYQQYRNNTSYKPIQRDQEGSPRYQKNIMTKRHNTIIT